LYDKFEKELNVLIKEDETCKASESSIRRDESQTQKSNQTDPLRVYRDNTHLNQPFSRPDNYGRSDLEPFSGGFNPLGNNRSGGMIFDPFRNSYRPMVPGNL
jgi:hypothetical protein